MSGIDWSRPRSLTARELLAALARDGFALRQQRGANRRYGHADGRRVTVSFHASGETFTPKTLRAMIELQAKWATADLQRHKLLK